MLGFLPRACRRDRFLSFFTPSITFGGVFHAQIEVRFVDFRHFSQTKFLKPTSFFKRAPSI